MDTVDAAGHSENAAVLDLRILGPLEAWLDQMWLK